MWGTPVQGARAIAAHRDLVLLYGGYADNKDGVWLGSLGSERSTDIGRRQIVGNGRRLRPQLVVGRGQFLHLVADGHWWRVDLAEHQV